MSVTWLGVWQFFQQSDLLQWSSGWWSLMLGIIIFKYLHNTPSIKPQKHRVSICGTHGKVFVGEERKRFVKLGNDGESVDLSGRYSPFLPLHRSGHLDHINVLHSWQVHLQTSVIIPLSFCYTPAISVTEYTCLFHRAIL